MHKQATGTMSSVEPTDAGQARRDCVGNANGHQHCRQHHASNDVVNKPGYFVLTERK